MMETQRNTEKSTFEAELTQLWQSLTHNQRRFAVAMLDCSSKKDAALSIGVEPNTVYGWPDVVDHVIELMLQNAEQCAQGILVESAVKAAMVKAAGLDSDDERIRQGAAAEILDRVLGRAPQKLEHTGEGGGPIKAATTIVVREYVSDGDEGG